MKKKYYILAFTFLCLLMGQSSFGQMVGPDCDDDNPYASLDAIVDGLTRLNNDIEVFEFSDPLDYVNAVNNDGNPENDFVDMNGDGLVNTSDNLFNQNIANTFGLPITMSDADLAAVLDGILAANRLNEVIVTKKYVFTEQFGGWNNGYVGEIDGIWYDGVTSIWNGGTYSNSSGGWSSSTSTSTSTAQSSSISDKILAMLKGAGINIIAMNPLIRTVTIARAIASYGIIVASSDSSCNGTIGGCQSWLNSNYIGASSSLNTATQQLIDGVKPIDMVDRAAFNHDVAYDNIGAAGATSALFDLATLPADKALLAACRQVTDMYNNGAIDPETGQAVSSETRERALLVIMAFEIVVTEKTLRN